MEEYSLRRHLPGEQFKDEPVWKCNVVDRESVLY